ncbi:hypothetical protein M231_04050 [Tremella mesenterica]|uniref:Uncharacterized protein n=1 Tax=Tremella mesenterica TaxID=5217 RepID=A0A4Q1BLH9_TREME|nr:hypothetical protein M231_04050 [Tremella mesenterica]
MPHISLVAENPTLELDFAQGLEHELDLVLIRQTSQPVWSQSSVYSQAPLEPISDSHSHVEDEEQTYIIAPERFITRITNDGKSSSDLTTPPRNPQTWSYILSDIDGMNPGGVLFPLAFQTAKVEWSDGALPLIAIIRTGIYKLPTNLDEVSPEHEAMDVPEQWVYDCVKVKKRIPFQTWPAVAILSSTPSRNVPPPTPSPDASSFESVKMRAHLSDKFTEASTSALSSPRRTASQFEHFQSVQDENFGRLLIDAINSFQGNTKAQFFSQWRISYPRKPGYNFVRKYKHIFDRECPKWATFGHKPSGSSSSLPRRRHGRRGGTSDLAGDHEATIKVDDLTKKDEPVTGTHPLDSGGVDLDLGRTEGSLSSVTNDSVRVQLDQSPRRYARSRSRDRDKSGSASLDRNSESPRPRTRSGSIASTMIPRALQVAVETSARSRSTSESGLDTSPRLQDSFQDTPPSPLSPIVRHPSASSSPSTSPSPRATTSTVITECVDPDSERSLFVSGTARSVRPNMLLHVDCDDIYTSTILSLINCPDSEWNEIAITATTPISFSSSSSSSPALPPMSLASSLLPLTTTLTTLIEEDDKPKPQPRLSHQDLSAITSSFSFSHPQPLTSSSHTLSLPSSSEPEGRSVLDTGQRIRVVLAFLYRLGDTCIALNKAFSGVLLSHSNDNHPPGFTRGIEEENGLIRSDKQEGKEEKEFISSSLCF